MREETEAQTGEGRASVQTQAPWLRCASNRRGEAAASSRTRPSPRCGAADPTQPGAPPPPNPPRSRTGSAGRPATCCRGRCSGGVCQRSAEPSPRPACAQGSRRRTAPATSPRPLDGASPGPGPASPPLRVAGAAQEQGCVTFGRTCFPTPRPPPALTDKNPCPLSVTHRLPLQGHSSRAGTYLHLTCHNRALPPRRRRAREPPARGRARRSPPPLEPAQQVLA